MTPSFNYADKMDIARDNKPLSRRWWQRQIKGWNWKSFIVIIEFQRKNEMIGIPERHWKWKTTRTRQIQWNAEMVYFLRGGYCGTMYRKERRTWHAFLVRIFVSPSERIMSFTRNPYSTIWWRKSSFRTFKGYLQKLKYCLLKLKPHVKSVTLLITIKLSSRRQGIWFIESKITRTIRQRLINIRVVSDDFMNQTFLSCLETNIT